MQVVDMYESGGRLGMTVPYAWPASFGRVLGSDVRPDSDRIRAAARHQLPATIQGCKTPRAAPFGSQRMIGLICVRRESSRFSGFGKARCVERAPDMMSSPTPRRCKCRIIPQVTDLSDNVSICFQCCVTTCPYRCNGKPSSKQLLPPVVCFEGE